MSILVRQGLMSLLECVLLSIFNSFCISIVVSAVFHTSVSNNQCFSSLVLMFYHLNQFFQRSIYKNAKKPLPRWELDMENYTHFKILNSHGKNFQFAMKLPLGNKPEKHCSGMKNGYNKYIPCSEN